jgi:subtilisin family serine protease
MVYSIKRFFMIATLGYVFLLLSACLAPTQEFQIGSEIWNKANPEASDLQAIQANMKLHKVLVGVLDAGIDYNSHSIQKNLRVFGTPAESGRAYGLGLDLLGKDYFPNFQILDPLTGQNAGEFVMIHDHGTHVSSLVTLNNPQIGLIPVRVVPVAERDGDSALYQIAPDAFKGEVAVRIIDAISSGIDFAVTSGATIINISLGVNLDEVLPEHHKPSLDKIENELLPNIKTKWKNALLVVAAGNESAVLSDVAQSIPTTLDAPDILSVGALKDNHTIASYSNHGRYVDVYMRGSDVTATVPGDLRKKLSGTSMASPLVAHLAAQLKIIDPTLSTSELRALIINAAEVRTASIERTDETEPVRAPRTVRVVDMSKARKIAKHILAFPADRAKWLKPPYLHGQAPH